MIIGWITFWHYDPCDKKFLKWRKNRYDHFLDLVELLLERHVRVVPVAPHLVSALGDQIVHLASQPLAGGPGSWAGGGVSRRLLEILVTNHLHIEDTIKTLS